MSGDVTEAGATVVLYLITGTLGVFCITLLWDFVRGLIRG